MSDLWREELQQVAETFGLRAEALEDWFARRETDGEEPISLAIRLSRHLENLAGVFEAAADGSEAAREIARQTAADLVSLAGLFDAPGLQEWAAGIGEAKGHLRLSHAAAKLCLEIADALRRSDDLDSLRERDGEWVTLPPVAVSESGPATAPVPKPSQVGPPQPAAPAPPLPVGPAAQPAAPAVAAHRVLVVAAPSLGREFLLRQLREAQLSVQAADNPFEAEKALAHGHFELVFVDRSPDTAGYLDRLAARPQLAGRIVLLWEGPDPSSKEVPGSVRAVLNKLPSREEIEAVLGRSL